jgi:predicted glycogen debranching enzyme
MIHFGPDICSNFDAGLEREWLETNGIGGFASSTINGCNTRRYHGLLVAAIEPPVGRHVLLSRLEETLLINGEAFDLGTNRYAGVVHPRGFQYLQNFRLAPFPTFTFRMNGVEIERSVFMVQGENTTVIEYRIANADDRKLELQIRPLIAFRDYHSLTHENGAIKATFEQQPGLVTFAPYQGLPALHIAHDARSVESTANWYRNFEYNAERERGLDFVEDIFNPCVLRFDLNSQTAATLIASTERHKTSAGRKFRENEIARRSEIAQRSPVDDDFVRSLTCAADQYIVSRGTEKSVIAGYHWFSDWGRDTMISLPGLTLTTGATTLRGAFCALSPNT